jgi:phospholipid/cholesterol/gamma-HCH transport system permease protein
MKHQNLNNGFVIEKIDSGIKIILNSPVTIKNTSSFSALFENEKLLSGISSVVIDCCKVPNYDSYIVLLINTLKKRAKSANIGFEVINTSVPLSNLIKLLTPGEIKPLDEEKHSGFYNYISHIGKVSSVILADVIHFVEFLGDVIIKILTLFIHPLRLRWKDFPFHFMKAGVNAVPISMLIVFLIGLISGYQGAMQLSQFGADIFIADLIGVSITRELGPLMVAILIAGRSGSAFAAEIGTMKVSEEIDALKSMGFDHINFLVLPRVVAVMAAMPLLVLIADVAGIAGGLIAALSTLEITIAGYMNELQKALTFAHVFTGVGKSIIFGFLISIVGCFRGLQVKGGAESVGSYTTISVVSGILLIIIADSIFTFIFQAIGI